MAYQKANKLHIVAVTAVIRNTEGKYLVLKRAAHEVAHPGLFSFPGGKVEDNGTVEEALAKEVTEETGLTMRPGKILLKDAAFVRPDGQSVKVFSYLVEVANDRSVKISDDFSEYQWVSITELESLPHINGITEELKKADAFYASGQLASLFQTKSQRDN